MLADVLKNHIEEREPLHYISYTITLYLFIFYIRYVQVYSIYISAINIAFQVTTLLTYVIKNLLEYTNFKVITITSFLIKEVLQFNWR